MNLTDIPSGARVFVDVNILVYARRGISSQCRAFLSRCQDRAIQGIITPFVLAEFCHRRMMQEAQASGLVASNPARRLSEKPGLIRNLDVYAVKGSVRTIDNRWTLMKPSVNLDHGLASRCDT